MRVGVVSGFKYVDDEEGKMAEHHYEVQSYLEPNSDCMQIPIGGRSKCLPAEKT